MWKRKLNNLLFHKRQREKRTIESIPQFTSFKLPNPAPALKENWSGFAIYLFLFLTFLSASAQDTVSVKNLIDEALEANYQIRIARNEALQAQNSNTLGNAGFWPTLDLEAHHTFSLTNTNQEFLTGETNNSTNAKSNAFQAAAVVNWIIFDGLNMFAQKERYEQLAKLGKTTTRFYIEQTVSDLLKAYYELLQKQKLLSVYQRSLEVSQSRLGLEQKRKEIGSGSSLDLQQSIIARNADSTLVLQQKVAVQTIKIEINRLLNRELAGGFVPKDSINLNRNLELQQLHDAAQSTNAELTAAQIQQLVAEQEVRISRAGFYPQISLFGQYAFSKSSSEASFLQSNRTYGPDLGVRVRFNLFNGGKDRIQTKNSRLELENAGLRKQQTGQEIDAALYTTFLMYESGLHEAALEKDNVGQARQTLNIAQRQYSAGTITDLEFRQIQTDVLLAESRLLEAEYRAKSFEIDLYRLSGTLLDQVY